MIITRVNMIYLLLSGCILIAGCRCEQPEKKPQPKSLQGVASYTPYDIHSMLWVRSGKDHTMAWVSSGAEAGNALVTQASGTKRPDWALCTQGVVAGLIARGKDVVILATVYHSDSVVLPVYRKPRVPIGNSRSLFIPKSSIEFAFDELLKREGLQRDSVRTPTVENIGFTTIVSLLKKPIADKDALDWAVLVEPFITNILTESPGNYEVGKGGLYDLHYCVVALRDDVKQRRTEYVNLLQQLLQADRKIQEFKTDNEFYEQAWGRLKDGQPERIPKLLTYSRSPAKLGLPISALRKSLLQELKYLTSKYPDQLRMPVNTEALVDPSLMQELASDRVQP